MSFRPFSFWGYPLGCELHGDGGGKPLQYQPRAGTGSGMRSNFGHLITSKPPTYGNLPDCYTR